MSTTPLPRKILIYPNIFFTILGLERRLQVNPALSCNCGLLYFARETDSKGSLRKPPARPFRILSYFSNSVTETDEFEHFSFQNRFDISIYKLLFYFQNKRQSPSCDAFLLACFQETIQLQPYDSMELTTKGYPAELDESVSCMFKFVAPVGTWLNFQPTWS